MIDIHTHLLPGVDDGSRSFEDSLGTLVRFRSQGVETVVCTPHLSASAAKQAPFDDHARLLHELQDRARGGIRLLSGWEIMLDQPDSDLIDPRLCLGGSNALLVEFAHTSLPPNSARELSRIRMSGRVPIVAHPERYRGCTIGLVEEWRAAGALIQMDVTAILSSKRMSGLTRDLLARGLCDVFASDTHVDSRSLAPVREWLREVGSEEHARLLTQMNAERLLNDEAPFPVPPLEIGRGVIDRLRRLLFAKG
jgi:protein-tyrosine phosphatase